MNLPLFLLFQLCASLPRVSRFCASVECFCVCCNTSSNSFDETLPYQSRFHLCTFSFSANQLRRTQQNIKTGSSLCSWQDCQFWTHFAKYFFFFLCKIHSPCAPDPFSFTLPVSYWFACYKAALDQALPRFSLPFWCPACPSLRPFCPPP